MALYMGLLTITRVEVTSIRASKQGITPEVSQSPSTVASRHKSSSGPECSPRIEPSPSSQSFRSFVFDPAALRSSHGATLAAAGVRMPKGDGRGCKRGRGWHRARSPRAGGGRGQVGKRVDGLERGEPGGRQRLSAGRYHR